jgi:DeoR family fructose operon transcriptional repressor
VIPYIRRKIILNELENREIVYISDLIPLLEDTSESTVRRDLKNLEDEGRVNILQGGAAKLKKSSSYDMPFESKMFLNTNEKDRIGRFAAELVSDGEVIYVDSGSSALAMVEYLKDRNIQIVTSNTAVLNQLQGSVFSCHLLGGEVVVSLGSIVGPVADNQLRELFFDKAFLGATGFSIDGGISTPDFRESSKKRIVRQNSKKVYVLADHTKYHKNSLCKAFEIIDCTIITDEPIPDLDGYSDIIVAP